jgi:hypothetical protein
MGVLLFGLLISPNPLELGNLVRWQRPLRILAAGFFVVHFEGRIPQYAISSSYERCNHTTRCMVSDFHNHYLLWSMFHVERTFPRGTYINERFTRMGN